MSTEEADIDSRSNILKRFEIIQTGSSDNDTDGATVRGYIFTSRLTNWTASYPEAGASIFFEGPTNILSITKGTPIVLTENKEYLIVNDITQVTSSVSSGYESYPVTNPDMETFLKNVINNANNRHIFFDSMYYYIRNTDFVSSSVNSIEMANDSILGLYGVSGRLIYYKPDIVLAAFTSALITNIHSYAVLPIRTPTYSGHFNTGQNDEFVIDIYTFVFSDIDLVAVTTNTGNTNISLDSSYTLRNGIRLKLVKSLEYGFPLFETSILGSDTPDRSTILRKITVKIAGTTSNLSNGLKVEGFVYASRFNTWAYSISSSSTSLVDGLVKILEIDNSGGTQQKTNIDIRKYMKINTETQINNTETSGYTSAAATKNEIITFLTTINFQSDSDYIFFDSMYHYMRNTDFVSSSITSIEMANTEIRTYYVITNTAKIWYYRPGITYLEFKNEINGKDVGDYHALPILRPMDSSVYNTSLLNEFVVGTYTITTQNSGNVTIGKVGLANAEIEVNDFYVFDSSLSLELALNPPLGFPLFRIYTAPTTTNVPCLLKGTRVLTPSGYKLIETLSVDDIISNHYNTPVEVRKISKTVVKWSENPTLDKKVFKTPGYQPTFLTGWHRIRGEDGTFLQAYDCGFDIAKKEEICDEDGVFEIYHLHVDDWQNNHLVVNGGTVVESWSGIYT